MSANITTPAKSTRIARFLRRLRDDQAGNTFMILAAGMFPMMAMVGSAVDIGREYMTQARLQAACDTGALAARRVMANPAILSPSDQSTGNRFFDFNFRPGSFGTSNVIRTYSKGSTDGTVEGVATVDVPMTVMQVFGVNQQTISVNCKSTLNVPNSDVMFVLDVTGSMNETLTDGTTKISGLKAAVKKFYTALGAGSATTGRVRYGFVPYSSTVSVGYLLPQSALVGRTAGDTWQYQSREPIFVDVYTPATFSTESAASNGSTVYSQVPSSYTNRTTDLIVGSTTYAKELTGSTTPSVTNSAQCLAIKVPFSSLTLSGSPTTTVSATTPTTANPIINRTYSITQGYAKNGTFYRYNWASNRCQLQSGTVTKSGTRKITYTTTQTVTSWNSVNEFSKWQYKERDIDVTDYVTGNAIANPAYHASSPNDTDGNAVAPTTTWAGCIEETESDNTITASTSGTLTTYPLDLRIDHIPTTSIPDSRWRPLWPEVEFLRFTDASTSNYTSANSDFGVSAYGACPTKARKLASYASLDAAPTDDSSLSSFSAYVDSLTPGGNTYHDIGMIWGARLLSPDGLFGAENAVAPNGFPIDRHIVFMTDGAMSTPNNIYDAWGINLWDARVSNANASSSTLNGIHSKRLEMICRTALAKGYTIWVVGFGISSLPTQVAGCASDSDHSKIVNTSTGLSDLFTTIAQSIGGLRLSQ
jgi:Flp pilus assembly protein TadG